MQGSQFMHHFFDAGFVGNLAQDAAGINADRDIGVQTGGIG
ncbi:hypothetical protein SDC9_187433 [bioreactor metagenome]|uniref:Uncharacterized protein n=1 Tax=bioreactor metagenome TaxID=1076179 RepID=A0A645HNT0_9ZZZZ